MNMSPERIIGLGGEFRLAVKSTLECVLAADARYTLEVVDHDVVGGVPVTTISDNVIDIGLGRGIEAANRSLTGFIDNLSDDNGALAPGATSLPLPTRQRPRTIGIQLTFSY
jgi:hypothetical protein